MRPPTQFRFTPEHSKCRGDVLSVPDHPTRRLIVVCVEELGVAVALAHHPVVKHWQVLLLVDPVPKTVGACHDVYQRRRPVSPSSLKTSCSLVVLHSLHMLPRDVDTAGEGGG